jgi:hypothetical protein
MLKAEFTSLLSLCYVGTDVMATMHEDHHNLREKQNRFLMAVRLKNYVTSLVFIY